MPLPLLRSTAQLVWKVHGKFTVKQIGSCYVFEFQDEESKLKVLEGGPYFFSRRFLVLKEWKRMLVPATNHPPTIPVWVKFHRLPFEFWTEVGFSKIASTIGKPIHVDEATATKKRLDFARICIEVDAADELPNDITIAVKADSVTMGIEYQWLPSSCQKCNVFGHTCQSKADSKPPPPGGEDDWLIVGKGKFSNVSLTSGNKSVSHTHQSLNPSKPPLNTTQNAPKPPAIPPHSVSVTPFSTSINKTAAPLLQQSTHLQLPLWCQIPLPTQLMSQQTVVLKELLRPLLQTGLLRLLTSTVIQNPKWHILCCKGFIPIPSMYWKRPPLLLRRTKRKTIIYWIMLFPQIRTPILKVSMIPILKMFLAMKVLPH